MPDDLRTRIADALLGDHCVQGMTQPCDDCRAHALRQADAVIRELRPQLAAWARMCVTEGDMTSNAEQQLQHILEAQ